MGGALLAFGPPTAASLELCRSQVLSFFEESDRPIRAVEVRLQHASGFSHGQRLWEVGERALVEVADEVARHIANSAVSGATVVARSDG